MTISNKIKSNYFELLLILFVFMLGVSFFGYHSILKSKIEIKTSTDKIIKPTNIKTIGTKTYQDKINNFSFNYPDNFTPKLTEDFPKDIYSSFTLFESGKDSFYLYVSQNNNITDEVSTIRSQTEGHVDTTLLTNESIKIGGKEGWILRYSPEKSNQAALSIIITSNDKNVIVLNINSNIEDQILSTFKFTE